MTLVLRSGNRYYADSKMLLGDTFYYSFNKIKRIVRPFKIECPKRKIKDYILGFTYTGPEIPVTKLIETLSKDGSVEMAELMYAIVGDLKLINADNHFEAILVGEKADYSFCVGFDREFIRVYPHTADGEWKMGSGSGFYAEVATRYKDIDPVRSMYLTFTQETSCGGMIDVWERFTEPYPHFRRVGMCEKMLGMLAENARDLLSLDELRKPYVLDYIAHPEKPFPRPKKRLTTEEKLKKAKKQLTKAQE